MCFVVFLERGVGFGIKTETYLGIWFIAVRVFGTEFKSL